MKIESFILFLSLCIFTDASLFELPVNSSLLEYSCCDFQSELLSNYDVTNEGKVSELLVFWGKLVSHDLSRFSSDDQPISLGVNCSFTINATQNLVTPSLDAGFIYGPDDTSRQLREKEGAACELRLIDGDIPKGDCTLLKFHTVNNTVADVPCTGDPRSSESLQILALQTLLVNEHNRLCKNVRKKSGGGGESEDVVFDKTRRRIIALVQKISMYEWLPALTNRFPMGDKPIPPYRNALHAIPPGATTTPEVTKALFHIFDHMHSNQVLFVDPTTHTRTIPFEGGIYQPDNMYAGFFNGHRTYCDLIYGMMQKPAAKLSPRATPESLINVPAATCKAVRGSNLTFFKSLQNALIANYQSLPYTDISELQTISTLSDITSMPLAVDWLKTLYSDASDDSIAASIDLLLGFLVETHGPVEKDIIGPLARFLFILQMTSFTRDYDEMWYERILSKEVVNRLNDEDGMFHLVQRHCPRFVNTKKFTSPFHIIQHEASESIYTGTTVDGRNGVFSSSSDSSDSDFTTTANTTSLILFICIIAILTLVLFILLFYVLRQVDNKKKN